MNTATPLPLIIGLEGPRLLPEEKTFLRKYWPLGVILFGWNIDNPAQTKELIASVKEAVGSRNIHFMVDAEGGLVWRFNQTFGFHPPKAETFGAHYEKAPEKALQTCYENFYRIGVFLKELGFTLNPAPLLDLHVAGASAVIGSRAFSASPQIVSALGLKAREGLKAGGIIPIIKHIPGHGPALVDSHDDLPDVSLGEKDMAPHLLPFQNLAAGSPWAMVAHIRYQTWDANHVATFSPTVIQKIIREKIGFQGILITDDLYMGALKGFSPKERVHKALKAGCHVALYGRGGVQTYAPIAKTLAPLSEEIYALTWRF